MNADLLRPGSQDEQVLRDSETPEEPSVLEYARFHGICADYLAEDPLNPDYLPAPPIFLLQEFEDPPYVCSITIPPDFPPNERLEICRAARGALKDGCTAPDLPSEDELFPDAAMSMRALKQELPILKTDAEVDLRKWGRVAAPAFESMNLPYEHVDEEKDEGLSWPKKYLDEKRKQDQIIDSERFSVTKDIMLHLQRALRDDFAPDDEKRVIEENLTYTKNPNIEPLTPPLLPLTPPQTPFELSSETGRLELLSEDTNSVADEARQLEEQIMSRDGITALDSSTDPMLLDEPGSALNFTDDTFLSPPAKRKATDLQVEGPLTPPTITSSSTKRLKTVSFPELLHEYIPELPSNFESGDGVLDSENSFDAFFAEHIAPMADEAARKAEQEQLQEVDTTRRVDVPVLDFSLPPAPWAMYSAKARGKMREGTSELKIQRQLLARCKREELKGMEVWRGVSKIDLELRWSPFPTQLGVVTIKESIAEEKALAKLIGDDTPGDIVDSASLVWKPDGLRILDDVEDDSDDELELGEYEDEGVEKQDMKSLLQRRNLELREEIEVETPTPRPNPPQGSASDLPTARITQTDGGQMFGGTFSASLAISKFIHARSGKPSSPKATETVEPPANHPAPASATVSRDPATHHPSATPPATAQTPPLPFPPTPSTLPPHPFILSSTIYTRRPLLRLLRTYYPTASFIERDFSTHLLPSASVPASAEAEADVLIAPATGLLLTSLQKIKQRALPGARPKASDIRARLAALDAKYERLFVLVGEEGLGVGVGVEDAASTAASTTAQHPRLLTPHDTTALSSLSAFAAGLDADISIAYVGGGLEALARWAVGIMARYGTPVQLLQDETLWELFLRRAGLDAYAAQVVLRGLGGGGAGAGAGAGQVPEPELRSEGLAGLAAFVLMSPEERRRRFEALFGGARVLGRVGRVLDQRWLSARDGFRKMG